MSAPPSLLWADAVLALHVAIAVFVVAGGVFVVVGNLLGWRYANNLHFRLLHLAAIAVVVAESWFGLTCPLTSLEMSLRAEAGAYTYRTGFVEHWLERVLYYSAPPWVFILLYTLFGLAVVASWCYFPPIRNRAARPRSPDPAPHEAPTRRRFGRLVQPLIANMRPVSRRRRHE